MPAIKDVRAPAPFSARHRIEDQLARMDAHPADHALAILRRRDSEARREASAWDELANFAPPPRLFGIGLAVKACFDVRNWPTTAASRILENEPAATEDAPILARLRAQGAIVTSQTNMTEFAFGALGLNPHFGSARTPLDPMRERIAGGSTSGGAVAVASGFADLALGSDTSGSVRIPAAFCGIAGFKPSAGRYPDGGIVPLSPSFDVPGFLGRTIETCALADHAVTGTAPNGQLSRDLRTCRFLVPPAFALEGADAAVTAAFQNALRLLEDRGATIVKREWSELARFGEIAVEGGIIVAEAYAWHQRLIDHQLDLYDPRVGPRILLGRDVKAATYIQAKQRLAELSIAFHRDLAEFDALLTPTVPILPPTVESLADDSRYYVANRQCYRLTEVANRIDAPSVTLPVDPQEPIGLLLTGRRGADRELLDVSSAVQSALGTVRPRARQE